MTIVWQTATTTTTTTTVCIRSTFFIQSVDPCSLEPMANATPLHHPLFNQKSSAISPRAPSPTNVCLAIADVASRRQDGRKIDATKA